MGERASRSGRSLPKFCRPPNRAEEATDILDWMASSESEGVVLSSHRACEQTRNGRREIALIYPKYVASHMIFGLGCGRGC